MISEVTRFSLCPRVTETGLFSLDLFWQPFIFAAIILFYSILIHGTTFFCKAHVQTFKKKCWSGKKTARVIFLCRRQDRYVRFDIVRDSLPLYPLFISAVCGLGSERFGSWKSEKSTTPPGIVHQKDRATIKPLHSVPAAWNSIKEIFYNLLDHTYYSTK